MVYNSQSVFSEKEVWNNLNCISGLNLLWFITGDFNANITSYEHKGGNFNSYSIKSKYINDFASCTVLFYLGCVGPCFTRCNNQHGLGKRWAS